MQVLVYFLFLLMFGFYPDIIKEATKWTQFALTLPETVIWTISTVKLAQETRNGNFFHVQK